MTVTDEQRVIATRLGAERHHRRNGMGRNWTPNGLSGPDINRIGLLGEFAFYNQFGGEPPDLAFIKGGDAGADVFLHPVVDGQKLTVPVDIKVTTFSGPGICLLVPVDRTHADALYIGGIYDAEADDVTLLRWEWGSVLIRENNTRTLPPHHTLNYSKLYRDCRKVSELMERCRV